VETDRENSIHERGRFVGTSGDVSDHVETFIASQFERAGHPLLVGINGPQGSGKSTIAAELEDRFTLRGLRVANLSLDDFYLSRQDRQILAIDVHPLLITRGVPGTHDVHLGEKVTRDLLDGYSLEIPRFSKEIDDRFPKSQWQWFTGPADIVILEGWCVGARPLPASALMGSENELEARFDPNGGWRLFWNSRLQSYAPWFGRIGCFIQLLPPSFDAVLRWRQQQEEALRQRVGMDCATMDDGEVMRFVQHYERLTRWMMDGGVRSPDLTLQLDDNRKSSRCKLGSSRIQG
jgi:D-glycerate 3-kinase